MSVSYLPENPPTGKKSYEQKNTVNPSLASLSSRSRATISVQGLGTNLRHSEIFIITLDLSSTHDSIVTPFYCEYVAKRDLSLHSC